jgi:hypothetical protein
MHLPQGKTHGTRNEVLQGNESTNAANIEPYFLKPHHTTLSQQAVSNGRLAVVISTPTIQPNVAMNLPSGIHRRK